MKRKRCSKCHVSRPLDGFYRRDGKPLPQCRICYRDYARRNYKPSAIRQMLQRLSLTPRGHRNGIRVELADRAEDELRQEIIKRAEIRMAKSSKQGPLRFLAAVREEERRHSERLRDGGEADAARRARETALELEEMTERRERLRRIEARDERG